MPTVIDGNTGINKVQDGVIVTDDLVNQAVSYAKMLQSDWGNSKATNGYQKLPSGLIIQWGITGLIASGANVTVTFPIAFPTAGLIGVTTVATASNLTVNYTGGVSMSPASMIVYGFGNSASYRWIVIGF